MDDSVTLIIPIRDRDAWRIEKLVGSLRSHGGDPRVIVVDYGSARHFAEGYAKIALSMGLEYERMETEGRPWNKCHAINRGVRLARSEYICTVDVDIYFVTDPILACKEDPRSRAMYHVNAYWLGKDGNERSARPAGLGGPGGYQFIARRAFEESGGYDERIVYWGQEDNDWPERLKALGYELVWLPEPHRVYHQWHESPEAGSLRPTTASFETMRCCIANRAGPVILQDWGKAVPFSERPVLEAMRGGNPIGIKLEPNALMKYYPAIGLMETKNSGPFIEVVLGPRFIRRPLSTASELIASVLRPLTAIAGLDCSKKINRNFDYFYAALPALKDNGLTDYYISRDLSSVFLIW